MKPVPEQKVRAKIQTDLCLIFKIENQNASETGLTSNVSFSDMLLF